MNKFQKLAYQIAKDDIKNGIYPKEDLHWWYKLWYKFIKDNKWCFEKTVDFKNWNKDKI